MNAQALFAMMVQQGDVVTDRFRDAVRHHPDQTFIRYGEEGRDLSFAAFEAEVATLAAALQEMGLEPDDRVSVFTRNSWIATLAMFAVWEAGAVYAPVNFNYAGRLLAYQLNDTAPRVLITDADLAPAVAAVLDEVRLTNIVVHRPLPSDHDHDPAKAALPPALLARPGLHDLAELMRTPRRHRPRRRHARPDHPRPAGHPHHSGQTNHQPVRPDRRTTRRALRRTHLHQPAQIRKDQSRQASR